MRQVILPWLQRAARVPRAAAAFRNAVIVGSSSNRIVDLSSGLVSKLLTVNSHLVPPRGGWEMASLPPGFDTENKDELTKRLIAVSPVDPATAGVYYGCNGNDGTSDAVLDAVRRTGRRGVFRVDHSYHGAGVATTPLGTDPRCKTVALGLFTLPRPKEDGSDAEWCLDLTAKAFREHGHVAKTLIFEGSSGSALGTAWPSDYVGRLVALAREHGVLTIADEVMSGLTRCAPEAHAAATIGCSPDLRIDYVVYGKALTNGTLPLSAVVLNDATPYDDDPFMRGRTFTGYPLGVYAALHQLDAIAKSADANRKTAAELAAALEPLERGGFVVRGRGLLRTVVVPTDGDAVRAQLLERRQLRVFGLQNRLVIAPSIGDPRVAESVDTLCRHLLSRG